MLTKNAIGNLITRYKAVLKKCHLLNTLGTFALAGAITLGGVGFAHAADIFEPTLDALDAADIEQIMRDTDPGDFNGDGNIDNDDTTDWNAYIDTLTIGDPSSAYTVTDITDAPSTAGNYCSTFTTKEKQNDNTYKDVTYGVLLKTPNGGTSNKLLNTKRGIC